MTKVRSEHQFRSAMGLAAFFLDLGKVGLSGLVAGGSHASEKGEWRGVPHQKRDSETHHQSGSKKPDAALAPLCAASARHKAWRCLEPAS